MKKIVKGAESWFIRQLLKLFARLGRYDHRFRIELCREMRQRGRGGPASKYQHIHGLDDKTLHGKGPVVAMYYEGDDVPYEVWLHLVRDWRD